MTRYTIRYEVNGRPFTTAFSDYSELSDHLKVAESTIETKVSENMPEIFHKEIARHNSIIEKKIETFQKEVFLRVEFKMREFITAVKNRLSFKHGQAFDMTRKSQEVWEAFKEVSEMIDKEIKMPLPYDDMTKQKKWEAKEKAVSEMVKTLDLMGRDYDVKVKRLVNIIETAQNF